MIFKTMQIWLNLQNLFLGEVILYENRNMQTLRKHLINLSPISPNNVDIIHKK